MKAQAHLPVAYTITFVVLFVYTPGSEAVRAQEGNFDPELSLHGSGPAQTIGPTVARSLSNLPRPELCDSACSKFASGELSESDSIGSGTTSMAVFVQNGLVIKTLRPTYKKLWMHECSVGARINGFVPKFANTTNYAQLIQTHCCAECGSEQFIIMLDVAPGIELGNYAGNTSTHAEIKHRIQQLLVDAWVGHAFVHNDVNLGNVMVQKLGDNSLKLTLFDYGFSGFDLEDTRNDTNLCVPNLDASADERLICSNHDETVAAHERDLTMIDWSFEMLANAM